MAAGHLQVIPWGQMQITTSSIIKKLAVLFLVVAGLYFAQDFLIPLSIGGLIATLLLPFSQWLEKSGINRFFSVFICLMVVLLFITSLVWLVSWQIGEILNDFTLVKERVITSIDHVQEFIINQLSISPAQQDQVFRKEQYSVTDVLASAAGSVTTLLTNFLLVLAYMFLFLFYRNHLKRFILKLFSPGQRRETAEMLNSIAHVSQQYLVGLSKMIACLWVMYGIGFAIVGVKNPIFFAILCGFCEIVPFIGNITGTAITVMVSLVEGGSITMLVGIVIIYGAIQFIQGWVLEPLILGPQVRINPFATIVALVLGSGLWGLPGVFLAIPLVAMFKVVCDHIESLKPIGFLIGVSGRKRNPRVFLKAIESRQGHN